MSDQKARKFQSSAEAYPSEPNRENRPSVEELGGLSEHRVKEAASRDEAYQVRQRSAKRSGGPPNESETVETDELAREFLKGAVQDPRPTAPDRTPAEEAARDDASASEEEVDDDLISEYPNLTDHEEARSRAAREQVRRARRGKPRPSDSRAIRHSKHSSDRRDRRSSHPG